MFDTFISTDHTTIMPSVIAYVEGQTQPIAVRMLLDTCASFNVISVSSANKVKHTVIEKNAILNINTVSGKQQLVANHISLTLCTLDKKWNFPTTAFVAPTPDIPQVLCNTEYIIDACKNEKFILNEKYPRPQQQVDIIIGAADLVSVFGDKKIQVDKHLALINTKWGFTLWGSEKSKNANSPASYLTKNEELTKQVQKMWELEKLPFDDDITGFSQEEVQAVDKINKVLVYNPDIKKFETELLFKKAPKFQNNYFAAKARLKQMIGKIQKDPSIIKGYNDVIADYLEKGIIEEVHDPLADNESRSDLFYLPHRILVDKQRLTTKHRIVYDASSRCKNGKSLNDCVLCGPKLQQDILAILIRFRSAFFTIISDISKMFLNCNIKPVDRDFLRFLYQNPELKNPVIRIFRFTTLVFGVVDSPFQSLTCLQKLVKMNREKPVRTEFEEKACQVIERDFYIDDCTHSCKTEEEAVHVRKALTDILAEGSFHIRKWISNSPKVLATIPEEDKAPATIVSTLFGEKQTISDTTTQLGYRYDPLKDLFLFDDYLHLLSKNNNDMRSVACLLASLYDPLGIISPYVLQARFILKEMFLLQKTWDDTIPDELVTEWKKWCKQLKFLKDFQIARYVPTNDDTTYLISSDASEAGYGCAAHARTYNKISKKYEVNLLVAKSRVSPVTNLSIPRLELKAALLAAMMAKFIHDELGVSNDRIEIFSDSEIVLFWLGKKPETLIPFVHNRIVKIKQCNYKFAYINTLHNPADIASRGATVQELTKNKLWLHGPDFWQLDKKEWPLPTKDFNKLNIVEGLKASTVFSYLMITRPKLSSPAKNQPKNAPINFERVPIVQFYSNYEQMLRKVAFLYYVMDKFRHHKKQGNSQTIMFDEVLNPNFRSYLDRAKTYLIQNAQLSAYKKEIQCLNKQQDIPFNSPLKKLNPFLDAGILKVGGRNDESTELSEAQKHQIILPKDHSFTAALARFMHCTANMHLSIDALHFQLRQEYWIMQSRQLLNKIIKSCMQCSLAHSARATQIMGQNPMPRVSISQPWMHVGVDLTGAIAIRKNPSKLMAVKDIPKHPRLVKKRIPTQPVYVVLFTCLATRAVHYELVHSNHEEEFLNSFLRFTSVYGIGTDYYSDNAQYFKAVQKSLQDEKHRVNAQLAKHMQTTFNWHFQTPRAGHCGSLWERMIKMMKVSLLKAVKKAFLTYTELMTVLRLNQAALNDRPLLKLSDDANTDEILTPSKLMFGRKIVPWVDSFNRPKMFVSADLEIRWRARERASKFLWKNFLERYLCELQTRNKWFQAKPNIKIGDVVLVEKAKIKRHNWPVMRVVDVNVGRDGRVRSVKLYKAYEKQPYSTRTIHQVFPLEAVNKPHIDFPQLMHDKGYVLDEGALNVNHPNTNDTTKTAGVDVDQTNQIKSNKQTN